MVRAKLPRSPRSRAATKIRFYCPRFLNSKPSRSTNKAKWSATSLPADVLPSFLKSSNRKAFLFPSKCSVRGFPINGEEFRDEPAMGVDPRKLVDTFRSGEVRSSGGRVHAAADILS